MKQKKINKKLDLNKATVVNLSFLQMKEANGGGGTTIPTADPTWETKETACLPTCLTCSTAWDC